MILFACRSGDILRFDSRIPACLSQRDIGFRSISPSRNWLHSQRLFDSAWFTISSTVLVDLVYFSYFRIVHLSGGGSNQRSLFIAPPMSNSRPSCTVVFFSYNNNIGFSIKWIQRLLRFFRPGAVRKKVCPVLSNYEADGKESPSLF